jgi:hypothetical protein
MTLATLQGIVDRLSQRYDGDTIVIGNVTDPSDHMTHIGELIGVRLESETIRG